MEKNYIRKEKISTKFTFGNGILGYFLGFVSVGILCGVVQPTGFNGWETMGLIFACLVVYAAALFVPYLLDLIRRLLTRQKYIYSEEGDILESLNKLQRTVKKNCSKEGKESK